MNDFSRNLARQMNSETFCLALSFWEMVFFFLEKTFTEQMAHVKYLKFHQIRTDKNR